jgi:hypothetical protein
MGILIERSEDGELYRDAYEEAQRIIRISEEVRISLEKIENIASKDEEIEEKTSKLTSSKLGQRYKLKTPELIQKLLENGYLEINDGKQVLTKKGQDAGGEPRVSPKFGPYFLWPEDLKL